MHLLLLLLLLLPGVHLLLLLPLLPVVLLVPVVLLIAVVLLVSVVLLVLRVFLVPGALPLLLLLGVHLLGVMPLPIASELLAITHPVPMTVVTVPVTTAITIFHLYAVTCMVALGALAGLVVVVLWRVLGELLDKEIWLGVWVLVWEMEVVARKVMREGPREPMIPGRWVLGGVLAVVGGW